MIKDRIANLYEEEEDTKKIKAIKIFTFAAAFINLLLLILILVKRDWFGDYGQIKSIIIGLILLNICSFNRSESTIIKLLKYFAALFVTTNLIWLTNGEISKSFFAILFLNILAYIPFTFNCIYRILSTKRNNIPLFEIIGISALAGATIMNMVLHIGPLTLLSSLSLLTLLPDAVLQTFYWGKKNGIII